MIDQHKSKPTLRLPPELKAAAQKVLDDLPERDEPWTLNDIAVATMAMLVKRPKTALKQLEPFKPPRKRGRPRKEG
jgi:predicted nucleic acid-binding protein